MLVSIEAQKRGTSAGKAEEPRATPSDSTESGTERVVRCASCDATVAKEKDAIEVFGAHEHDRMNPGGYLFRLACFARADGTASVGERSTEFPWFPHHTWTIAVCSTCIAHLGWQFQREGTTFYGLIVDRISRS